MAYRFFLSIVICFFAIYVGNINGQLSLDEMINKIKHDNKLVFNSAGPPAPPILPPPSAQLNTAPSGVQVDSRYDPRISNFVSSKILQIAYDISMLYRDQAVKNSIISPMSIAGALSLVLLGANGQTFIEIMRLFGFDQDQTLVSHPYKIHEEFGLLVEDLLSDYQNPARPRPVSYWKYMIKNHSGRRHTASVSNQTSPSQYHYISVANGIFTQTGFSLRPSYQAAVQDIYRSEIVSLDFRGNIDMAKQYINNWVKYKTRGKIEQIVGAEINSNTNMIIASSLYFKALWEQTFIDGATNRKNFYPNGLSSAPILVDMMAHGGEFPFYDATEYDCRILGFPYRGNQTTMYIILPNNSSRQRLREIQTHLTPERIEDMISKMQMKTAIILFPKLHIQNSIDLKVLLKRLGVNSLFSSTHSDLSLVSSGHIQNIANVQKMGAGFVSNPVNAPPMDPKIPVFQPEALQGIPILSNSFVPQRMETEPVKGGNLENELIFSRFGSDDDDHDTKSTQTNPPATKQPATEQTTLNTPVSDQQSPKEESVSSANSTNSSNRSKRSVTYKVESSFYKSEPPLRYKDFVLSKRIVKAKADKKLLRGRRQIPDLSSSIKQLDVIRNSPSLRNPGIFADAIVHKIDLTINEQGTEGGAATAVYLTRTGTDVVFRVETPFLLLIRHDATKLPLFYGSVYEPTD